MFKTPRLFTIKSCTHSSLKIHVFIIFIHEGIRKQDCTIEDQTSLFLCVWSCESYPAEGAVTAAEFIILSPPRLCEVLPDCGVSVHLCWNRFPSPALMSPRLWIFQPVGIPGTHGPGKSAKTSCIGKKTQRFHPLKTFRK